jgi:WD40 repeat protein
MNNDLIRCPYFGLQPATENDTDYFFGRESDRQIIKTNLYGQPLTVLYGTSGVGKSSLLLAGVVPQLRKPNQLVVVFREYQEQDIGSSLKRAVLEAVRASIQGDPSVNLSLPLDEFLLACNRVVHGPVFIIFDQFESYFLYHPPSSAINEFEAQFAKAINRQDIDVHLLLALREDRLSNLDRFQGRVNSFQNMLRVEHMTRAAATEAIRKPLEQYNRGRQPGQGIDIEDELVRELLNDVSEGQVTFGAQNLQAGGRVETPSLQLALVTLWREEMAAGSPLLRLETYRRLGGARSIVGTHLDRIMEQFDEPGRRLAARMFRYLVTPTGTKVAHTAKDLATYTEAPINSVEEVLDALCKPGMRILHPVAALPGQPDMKRYEIFHDVLGPAVLEWQTRYREAEVIEAAQVREAELRQVERAKRLRQTVLVMAVALLMLSGATIYAFRKRAEANRQSAQAVRQSEEAERQRSKAEISLAEAQWQRKEAQNARRDAEIARDEAFEAKKLSEKSLQSEMRAKAEAERRAKEANIAKSQAELALTSEKHATAEAKEQKTRADKERNNALLAQQRADVERTAAQESAALAEDERSNAVRSADAAKAAEQKADYARNEAAASIDRIKEIDASAPFSRGVIRNDVRLLNAVFRPDIDSIVTYNENGQVLFWKIPEVMNPPKGKLANRSEEVKPDLAPSQGAPLITALSADGKLRAVANADTVSVRGLEAGAQSSGVIKDEPRKLTMPANVGRIKSLAVTSVPGERFVAAGTENGWLAVWNLDQCDAEQGRCQPVSEQAHSQIINSIAFSPDGRFIATASGAAPEKKANDDTCESSQNADNTAKVWAVSWDSTQERGQLLPIKTLAGHRCRVNSVAFNDPDSVALHNPGHDKKILRVVTASDDGTARAWNVLRIRDNANGTVKWKEVDTNTYTLNVYEAPRVRAWILRQPLRKIFGLAVGLEEIKKVQVPIYTAVFSPVDDNIVVTSGQEGALRVWDVASSSTVRILQGHYDSVRNVAFSADGQSVVTAGDDKTVRLWSLCQAGEINAKRSVIANLTTKKARQNLEKYCREKVNN